MDSVVENQGFYDYINHIIVGFVFLLGIEAILIIQGFNPISQLYDYLIDWQVFNDNTKYALAIIGTIILIIICFIIGMMSQEVYHALFENNHNKENIIEKKKVGKRLALTRLWKKTNRTAYGEMIFTNKDFFGNSLKYNSYWNLAVSLIKDKGLDIDLNKNKNILSSYFFAYCVYYNQVNGNQKKTEKLRDIEGLTSELSLVFTVLSVISGAAFLFRGIGIIITGVTIIPQMIYSTVLVVMFVGLAIGFDCTTERAVKNRVKMTLAVFEVDKDIKKEKQKEKKQKEQDE